MRKKEQPKKNSTRYLTGVSEKSRSEALKKFYSIRAFLEDGVPLPRISEATKTPLRTLRRWVQRYRETGLVGLTRLPTKRAESKANLQIQHIIEGFYLHSSFITSANVKRRLDALAAEKGWPTKSYSSINRIIRKLERPLIALAHEGPKFYAEKFDIVYRRECKRPNEMWQADHTLLDCWVLDTKNNLGRPWLTVILDDYSRAVCGYFISLDAPSSLNTALALHQAMWRKTDPRWHVLGIPDRFYTDNGPDFTSLHMQQVAADLGFELVFSVKGKPRGRGKIERFFRTVDDLFLKSMPGYVNKDPLSVLPIQTFCEQFHEWLVGTYLVREHSELLNAPQSQWEKNGFLPNMVDSLERLDLLLLTVARSRKVQQDGIHFQSLRYMDPTLAAFVGEAVVIRYDPRDLAVIRVFHNDALLCRAVRSELASSETSLKEITRARNARRRELKATLTNRSNMISEYISVHQNSEPIAPAQSEESVSKLKRYINE